MKNIQHKNLANGEWNKKPLLEQMANIGSEVYRAVNWKEKGNIEYSNKAFNRSLELFDLTKESSLTYSQLKELLRMRELWIDYFVYENEYNSTKDFFNSYFKYLTIASRNQ